MIFGKFQWYLVVFIVLTSLMFLHYLPCLSIWSHSLKCLRLSYIFRNFIFWSSVFLLAWALWIRLRAFHLGDLFLWRSLELYIGSHALYALFRSCRRITFSIHFLSYKGRLVFLLVDVGPLLTPSLQTLL